MPGQAQIGDVLTVETPESVAFAYELAGLGSRGLALSLDSLAIVGIVLVEGGVLAAIAWAISAISTRAAGSGAPWLLGAFVVLAFLTSWGYFIVGEGLRGGRTWGKKRLGIRVVRDDGSRARIGDAIIRNLLRLVDALPGSYAIGMFAILFTRRNKRLGDMAAGTVVIRDTGDEDLTFLGGGVPPAILLAREFLDRRPHLTEPARWQVGVEVLRALGEDPEPTWDEPLVAGRIADLSGWRQLQR
jgi:uncharacterized RDD family membrane protein YckC